MIMEVIILMVMEVIIMTSKQQHRQLGKKGRDTSQAHSQGMN